MSFSFTGVTYLFLFFAIGYLANRFFGYQQRIKDTASKIFFYFTLPLVFFAFFKAAFTILE